MSAQHTPGMCPTLRHIRREHSSLNMRTGEVSAVEKVTWATEPCARPLFGNDRARGQCCGCADGWEVPGSRLATSCALAQAQDEYAKATGSTA